MTVSTGLLVAPADINPSITTRSAGVAGVSALTGLTDLLGGGLAVRDGFASRAAVGVAPELAYGVRELVLAEPRHDGPFAGLRHPRVPERHNPEGKKKPDVVERRCRAFDHVGLLSE